MSLQDKQTWGSVYALLLKTAHDSIQDAGRTDVMLYASFDRDFKNYNPENTVTGVRGRAHINNQYILDALKNELGVSRDWAISIHPYGDDPTNTDPQTLTFAGLRTLSTQMENWLRLLGATDVAGHPQSRLFAAEQGIPRKDKNGITLPDRVRAEWICKAHREAIQNPYVLAVTHNHFQQTSEEEKQELDGGQPSEGNEFFFGLLPWNISGDAGTRAEDFSLLTLDTHPIGRAYISTFGNGGWNQTNTHYCCSEFNLGCLNTVKGWVDDLVLVPHQFTLRGWSCATGLPNSMDVHVYAGDYPSNLQFVKAATANLLNEPAVTEFCGGAGANYRFEIPFTRAEVSAHQGKPLHVFGISPVGGANPVLGRQSDIHMPMMPADY
jgi:hypothetical protein